MPRHILIKLTKLKDKEKILKATREKQQITYKGMPIRLTTDFSAETQMSIFTKWKQTHRHRKQTHGYQKGKVGGGIN